MKTAKPIDRLLVWAFQREAAGRGGGGLSWGLDWGAESRDGVLACARNGYGLRVDGSGLAKAASQRGHPDAEALYDAVAGVPLLIEYARQGGTPDWMPGARPRPVARRRDNGKPELMRDTPKGPLYCALKTKTPQHEIDRARRVYAEWWESLEVLAAAFRDGALPPLRDWEVLPPSVPARPWEAEGGPEKPLDRACPLT